MTGARARARWARQNVSVPQAPRCQRRPDRDRRSYERLRDIGAHNVELGADFSVFLPRCLRRAPSPHVKPSACVVSIAVNEAMERIYGLEDAASTIADVLKKLAAQHPGVEAIVLSHDYRVFGPRPHTVVAGDFAELLSRKLPQLPVRFLDARLQAAHALQLARSSRLVISGVMHYALMASFAGTRATSLPTMTRALASASTTGCSRPETWVAYGPSRGPSPTGKAWIAGLPRSDTGVSGNELRWQ